MIYKIKRFFEYLKYLKNIKRKISDNEVEMNVLRLEIKDLKVSNDFIFEYFTREINRVEHCLDKIESRGVQNMDYTLDAFLSIDKRIKKLSIKKAQSETTSEDTIYRVNKKIEELDEIKQQLNRVKYLTDNLDFFKKILEENENN